MPRLKSSNFAKAELADQILDSATSPLSFTVDDASSFPDEGPFMILIHDKTAGFAGVKEFMEVGTITKGTNTLSAVTRAREGTSAVTHAIGASVECVWTKGTHQELADAIYSELMSFPGYYIITEFDTPTAGDITETMYKPNDAVFLTRVTEFDEPTAGDITTTLQCTELGIHHKVVTEFDTPTAGDIKETASEVV